MVKLDDCGVIYEIDIKLEAECRIGKRPKKFKASRIAIMFFIISVIPYNIMDYKQEFTEIYVFIFVLLFCLSLVCDITHFNLEYKQYMDKRDEEILKIRQKDVAYREKYDIPEDAYNIVCIDVAGHHEVDFFNRDSKFWRDEERVYIVTRNFLEDVGIIEVKIDDIESFARLGDMHEYTEVKGGGTSIGGAIVGGIIAGDTGAIIGSREEVRSEHKVIDKRKTILMINENNRVKCLTFEADDYDVFVKLIPEKELSFVLSNRSAIKEVNNISVPKELREYKGLLDDGIISKEEFELKKRELLKI